MIRLSTARETYWLTHELWYRIQNIQSIKRTFQSLQTIFNGKEAIWSWNDPLPFLLVYPLSLNLRPSRVRFFHKIDCCLG